MKKLIKNLKFMKKLKLLLLFTILPFLCFSQAQIGEDIDGEAGDQSGSSVSVSSDGNIVALGAPTNSENGDRSGMVRIHKNLGGVWTQIGDDINGAAALDFFGKSVSLSMDGSILAVGANPIADSDPSPAYVRIYQNIDGAWSQIGSDINGDSGDDQFGFSLSLSSDGNIVAVGARLNDANGLLSGHVRIYENLNGIWTQIGSDIDGENQFDQSGYSVSLSSDGSIVAIGAPGNSANGFGSGHVRIYENIDGTWTQIGSDIDSEADGDAFGTSISLSSDGSILAIGAPENSENGFWSGHVRIYENIDDTWTQIGDDIDGETSYDQFGTSVNLSANGSIVAIGAILGNSNNTGSASIYENVGGVWTQIGSDINGETTNDHFGSCISISSDGSIVAIGAPYNSDSGHVRVYDVNGVLSLNKEIIINFNVYPNPAKTQFTIALKNSLELKNVKVYNNLGQLVLSTQDSTIDSSKLSAGQYIVEIHTNKGKSSKNLIIE